jgi:hypothetical protein
MIGVNSCCVVSDDVQLNEGEKLIVIWLVNQVLLLFFLTNKNREELIG